MRWAEELQSRWRMPPPGSKRESSALRLGIELLAGAKGVRPHPLALAVPEHPFDSHLLRLSPLYRKSRAIYLERDGKFQATLVSSPRTLSSPTLLENLIEYSPIARELSWAATDPGERGNVAHLGMLRSFVTSIFHEQSHRIIWSFLPPPTRNPRAICRYLNFVESLAITTDMALGDELGPGLAGLFYLIGLTYDRGTEIRSQTPTRRDYRNYLHAALYATYLNLEMVNPDAIPKVISVLYPSVSGFSERAARRSARLDRAFVQITNPLWQDKHADLTLARLNSRERIRNARKWRGDAEPIEFGKDIIDNRLQYLLAERWFQLLGL